MAGEVHCDDRPNSDYDLSLCRLPGSVNVGVDASVMGNHARFVNDFRGIAIKPNALFVDTKTASGEIRISIWSSNREIKKGEEILVSYGKTWWRFRAHLAPKVTVWLSRYTYLQYLLYREATYSRSCNLISCSISNLKYIDLMGVKLSVRCLLTT